MLWLSKIWELGLDTGRSWMIYVWPVSRSIQGGAAGSLKWKKLLDMIREELQIRFQLIIRFRFRILICDPDWTIFSR
jgi:hypothetical protein